jgi:hypothetical protein
MQQIDKAIECIQAAATELNLLSLNTVAHAMGADTEESVPSEVIGTLGSQAA